MDYKVKNLPKSQLEIKFTLDEKTLSKYKEQAISQLWKNLKVSWFRKWHVPGDIVEKTLDPNYINTETINIAVNKSFKNAVQKEWFEVLWSPNVNIIKDIPLEFVVVIDIYPKIDLWDYKDVKLKRSEIVVEKKEIDEQIEILRGNLSEEKKKDSKIKDWDVAKVDFEWFDKDWNPVENTKSIDFKMDIWSWKMIPWFEQELVWMSVGDEKDFPITFPKDYHVQQMAWVKYKFHIKVNEVYEKVLPEVNDEFVKKIYWSSKTVDFLRNDIETHIKSNKLNQEDRKLEEDLLGSWSKKMKFDVPQSEIDKKLEFMIDNIKMWILQQWMPWDHYLKHINKTEDDIKKEIEPEAIENVRKSYIIQEIIKIEKFSATDEEVEARIKEYEFQAMQQGKKFDKQNYEKWSKWYLNIISSILVFKVFDRYLPKRS